MGCQQHAWPAHAPEQVEAEVNYIRDNGQRPVAYTYPAPAGTPQRSALLQPTRVAIRNARLLAQPASLEREGFQLVREASAVGDFEDEAQVRERYYPESIALLRRLTGAAEAVIFDHTLRVDQAGREERGLREPVRYVHNDHQGRFSGPGHSRQAPAGAYASDRRRCSPASCWCSCRRQSCTSCRSHAPRRYGATPVAPPG